MVSYPRARRILVVGLPIVGGMISQNVLDLVDTLMVGQVGTNALAAVGIASFANFLACAVLVGLAGGVQAMVARRKGEGRVREIAIPLNGGLFLALVIGVPLTVVLLLTAEQSFRLLVSDPGVLEEGIPYWIARLWGTVAIGLNFCFRGYWHGIGETRVYLRVILIMHACNLVLNYLLIFGAFGFPELGTLGAGIGTTVSLFVGTITYAILTSRRAREHGFLERLPRGQTFTTMVQLSIPSAIQTFLFAAGLTTLFWILGQVSAEALAISNVLINMAKLAVLPAMGLGLAAMTLVSTSLGEGRPEEASRWGWDTVKVAAIALAVVAVPMVIVPEAILAVFLTDPAVAAQGVLPLRLLGLMVMAEAVGSVLMQALIGAGAARTTLLVTSGSQWLLALPLAYVTGVWLGGGLIAVWVCHMGYRAIAAGVFATLWARGQWQTLKI